MISTACSAVGKYETIVDDVHVTDGSVLQLYYYYCTSYPALGVRTRQKKSAEKQGRFTARLSSDEEIR